MNAVQTLNRVNFYVDVTRNARYYFSEISIAVNDAIFEFVSEKMGEGDQRSPENFEWNQQVRDELWTLVTTATPTITTLTSVTSRYYSFIINHVNFPTDYQDFIGIDCVIDGATVYGRPTSYNEVTPLLEDSYKHPTNVKPYYLEDNTGLKIYRGTTGTISSCTLKYIKFPTDFSLGQESNLIDAGTAIVTATSYIATQVSVQNGTTYQIGTQFTSVGTVLTSGQVILASLTSPISLPDKTHEEICQRAAKRLLFVVSNPSQGEAIKSISE